MKKQTQETTDDKVLGKVIASELRRQLSGVESDCPETETVAAFYDRTLSDRERAEWEKHFLSCMRCQEYLAELARLADADEPPPLMGDNAVSETVESSPGWFYRLAWVIPFLVIGIGSAIWYQEDIQRFMHHSETAANTSAPALATEQPSSGAEKKSQDKGVPVPAKSATPAPAAIATAKSESERQGAPAETAQAVGGAAQGVAASSARGELADSAKSAETTSRKDMAEMRPPSAENSPRPAVAPAAANTSSESAAGIGAGRASGFGALSVRGAQQKVVAPWRVGRRGTIQKSDGQGEWTRVVSGVQEDLFDITFAGTTGWAVGQNGVVVRSDDGGNTWQKVTSPTSEDLVRVSSLGAKQASVFSRSGKTYSTNDGGQSWK